MDKEISEKVDKEISEKERENIIKKVFNHTLSDDVLYFVKEYERVFGRRDRFLWKWLAVVFKESGVTLSTVPERYLNSVNNIKVILTIFISILDDIADFYKDEKLLKALLEIPNEKFEGNKLERLNEKILFAKKLWQYIMNKLSEYPRYKEFKDIFEYDLKQVLNSMHYSYLVNKNPGLINLIEAKLCNSHNMIVFLYSDIDLMVSPRFNKDELTQMRTIFWHAQQMARIGNWLSTWKRELREDDLSSGVLAYAITNKVLSKDELNTLSRDEVIKKIENSDMKKYFINSWRKNYRKIQKIAPMIKSVDVNAYLKGLENLFKFHLASEGLK